MINFINKYGIYSILLVILLEYACFPIPSEVVLPLSGLILKSQSQNFIYVVLLSSIAGIVGTLLCYLLGRLLGYRFLMFMMKKFPSSTDSLNTTKNKYLKSAKKSVLFGRLIPICRTYISFFSGIYKQNIIEFILYSFIGIFIWNSFLMGLGYFFYDKIDINIFYENYKIITLLIIGLYIIIHIIKKEIKQRKKAIFGD